jgi:hypothetical protein
MKQHYLPFTDSGKRDWLNNFSTQLGTHGATVGVTPAEITEVDNEAKMVAYLLTILDIFKSETHERTTYKELVFDGDASIPLGDPPELPAMPTPPAAVTPGVFKRVARLAKRIKAHPNYTEAIGKNLGIVGSEQVIDYDNLKVQVAVRRTDADGVALDFVKGKMDGVVVYSGTIVQPAGTPETGTEPPVLVWTELNRATTSPFVDTRYNEGNLPETRYYKMRYLKKDLPVGQDSDMISVIAVKFKAGAELAGKVK